MKRPNSAEWLHKADLIISLSQDGIIITKDRYRSWPKTVSMKDVVEVCATLLSRHLFKNKFEVFKSVLEDDLIEAIGKVLKFYINEKEEILKERSV